MEEGKLSKIARRIVAFTCRVRYVYTGFGYDGADKGMILFNRNYYPLMWAYPTGDGKVKFVMTRKDEDAFDNLMRWSSGLGEFGEDSRNFFISNPGYQRRGVRNFRIMLWNEMSKTACKKFKGANFIINNFKTLSMDEAMKFLTTKYDIAISYFQKIFGGEGASEVSKFTSHGMNFTVNDSLLTGEKIDGLMDEVKSKLPPELAGKLLYGNVELKKEFAGSAAADYDRYADEIRMSDGDNFVPNMIHELGHRWHFKFCNPNQSKALQKLYSKCRKDYDKPLELSYGDTVELNSGKLMVIVGEDDTHYKFYYANDEESREWTTPKESLTPSVIKSLNGKEVKTYELPRKYAGKNILEFVACCFEHIFAGYRIDANTAREFLEIVNGE